MQKFICMGRLTRDPEVKYSGDTCYARFGIAVDRKYKKDGDPDADFFNCVCFGKTAQFSEKYLAKGKKIMISGRIENNEYTNKEGQKVKDIRVIVEEIEFAESKRSEESKESAPKSNNSSDDGFINVPDGTVEDLPFN